MGGKRHWSMAVALAATFSSTADAQTALIFDTAQVRFDQTSRALSAADHGVYAAKAGANAMRTLHRPIVTA